MAAEVKVNLKKLEKYISSLKPLYLEEYAKEAVRVIKGETRSGNLIKNKSLSSGWIEERGRIAEATTTNRAYRQSTSNLTLSGQLIDAVTYEVNRDEARVYVQDTKRRGYRRKNKNGTVSRLKSTATNKEIAEYQAEMGRKFMDLSSKSREIILNKVIQFLRRQLRRR